MSYAIPYCFAFLFILFFEFVPKESGTISKKVIPAFGIIVFLLYFIGFRGFIVTDWVSYYPYFDNVPSILDNRASDFIETWPWEKGFLIYSVLIKTFSTNYFFFQFVSFLFDLIVIHITFKRYLPERYLPIAYASLFVFQGFVIEVNLLRNQKVIMLFLLSVPYLQNRKFLKYFILNLCGGLFHVSGFLYIPLYFVLNKKFSKRLILFLFVVGNVFFFCRVKIVSTFLVAISPFLEGSRFGSLINAYGLISDEFSSYAIGIGFLERTLTFFLIFHFQNKILRKNPHILQFINLLYLCLFCYLYLAEVGILIQRITLLFISGYWIFYPNLYSEFNKSNKCLFILVFAFYGILKMIAQCDEPTYLYTNILYEQPDYYARYELFKRGVK